MSLDEIQLGTERLLLRAPTVSDADALRAIVADPRVALTTASIPHPYPDSGVLEFIERVRALAGPDRRNFAITVSPSGSLIGMVGFVSSDREAELAYMLSPEQWGRGYATEAAREVVRFVFGSTRVSAVTARAMTANPASENVLRRAGFTCEGEDDVELPIRGAVCRTSFWRIEREHHDPPIWATGRSDRQT
ncbi:GNAT family N-acetyltransferase [Novosphingobium profundi]|uniref:GNAT family N-acetyltransferase n=1 Tax=Novosphingobium profundi TaxID=1774954 RepID=UPI001BDB56A1|nr:GNAT family N-acetyltransferase [Novosphingobium profundi]MBT0670691.1 GNAT family N-acetyltransferase [Novosphingobium profundi]